MLKKDMRPKFFFSFSLLVVLLTSHNKFLLPLLYRKTTCQKIEKGTHKTHVEKIKLAKFCIQQEKHYKTDRQTRERDWMEEGREKIKYH